MSKYNVGDKFVIEITKKHPSDIGLFQYYTTNNGLFLTEAFFDKAEQLERYDPDEKANADYNAGYAEGLTAGEKKAKAQAELDVCHDIEAVAKRNYERGFDDAWEAAKTAYSMEDDARERYIGWRSMGDVFDELTPAQVIEGVREYEEKKKEEEEIKVGDEVTGENFHSFIVIRKKDEMIFGITEDGRWAMMPKDKAGKTGRHFPQIAEVLKEMKGE